MAEELGPVAGMIMAEVNKGDERARIKSCAQLVIQLATITLLIDAKITTREAAVQRIDQIRRALPEKFQGEDVSTIIESATELLQSVAPSPAP